MSGPPPAIKRLQDFAERYGTRIEVVARVPTTAQAPFSRQIGLFWSRFVLFIEERAQTNPVLVGSLVHELGHLLATRRRPYTVNELNFLGWEWRVATELHVLRQWHASMADYVVYGDSFGNCSPGKKKKLLQLALMHGVKAGNIDVFGRPVCLRSGPPKKGG